MSISSKTIRLALMGAVPLALLAGVAASTQSGRCWMDGYVVGERDNPGLAGATVELIGDPDAPRLRDVKQTAKADGEGKYALTEIPHGEYTLRVTAPGYAAYKIPIYMLSDTHTMLHVKLKKEPAPGEDRK
jgi:hypothetical protein